MKPLHAVLGLSLVANGGLVVYVLHTPAAGGAASTSTGGVAPPPRPVSLVPAGSAATKPPTAAELAAMERIWSEHPYENPADMTARLRAAGLSPAMMHDFLAVRLKRPPAAAAPIAIRERPALSPSQVDRNARIQQVRTELDAYERSRYGDLPREKINQLKQIEADYNDLSRTIRAQAPGTLIPEDREKLSYLDREKLADLAKVLTPAELDDYQIRTSSTALVLTYLRDQAVGFRATEEEYRAVVRATLAANAQFGVSSLAPVPVENWRQYQQAIADQLGKALSPERLADYQRASEPNHRALDALATRLELPATTSDQLLALQTDFQKRVATIQVTYSRDPATRAAQLADLSAEANRKFTDLLTPRGLEAYRTSVSLTGTWLRSFLPAQPAPPKS